MYDKIIRPLKNHPDITFTKAIYEWRDIVAHLTEGSHGFIYETGLQCTDQLRTVQRYPKMEHTGNDAQYIEEVERWIHSLRIEIKGSTASKPDTTLSDYDDSKYEHLKTEAPKMVVIEEEKKVEEPIPEEVSDNEEFENQVPIPTFKTSSSFQPQVKKEQKIPKFLESKNTPEEKEMEKESNSEQTGTLDFLKNKFKKNKEQPKVPKKNPSEVVSQSVVVEPVDVPIEEEVPNEEAKKGKSLFSIPNIKIGFSKKEEKDVDPTILNAPHRILVYSPKGGSGTTHTILELAKWGATQTGVVEIAYPYGQLAGMLNIKPRRNVLDVEEGKEVDAVCKEQFLVSPFIHPIRKTVDEVEITKWLERGQRAFPGKMVFADMFSQAPMPILCAAHRWSTKALWIVHDTPDHYGMTEFQLHYLRENKVDLSKIGILVYKLHGEKLPWKELQAQVIGEAEYDQPMQVRKIFADFIQ